MANGKSIYDVYFEAGESAGEYEGSKAAISGTWDTISQGREDLTFEQQRISDTMDTLAAAVELGGEYFGGKAAQQEFETVDVPQTQKEIARQQYIKSIEGKEGMKSWDELTSPIRTEWIDKFKPIKVGKTGETWESYNTLEKLWEKPLYRFGEEEHDFVFKKSDVQGISQFSKYGMMPKLSAFSSPIKRSLLGEVNDDKSQVVTPKVKKTTPPSTKVTNKLNTDFMEAAKRMKQWNQVPSYADWAEGNEELLKAAIQIGWDKNLGKWK